jgi:predicted metalloprotease with PDZ domain
MGTLSSETDRAATWFKEGFTTYYGYLLVYRAGALPIANYVDSLNRDLRQFPTSTDPYVRGRIIALWLDGAIRRESRGEHSLDDVMFDMVRTGDQPITLARILETAGRYLSADARRLLQLAVVDHGGLPAPDQAPLIGGCAHPSLQDLPTFELGLDLARSRAASQLTGVVEGGPAFAAGLRNGQALTGFSVNNGDPDLLARFTIHTDSGDKQIAFYPRGKTVAAWQYRLDQNGPCGRVF